MRQPSFLPRSSRVVRRRKIARINSCQHGDASTGRDCSAPHGLSSAGIRIAFTVERATFAATSTDWSRRHVQRAIAAAGKATSIENSSSLKSRLVAPNHEIATEALADPPLAEPMAVRILR
jgi:hypothetical protein